MIALVVEVVYTQVCHSSGTWGYDMFGYDKGSYHAWMMHRWDVFSDHISLG